ncbi:MAG TPA: tetraacyldisaccharide 4'-kinase [Firmicutes bacterium]|jgi:tetraacyldisaccharide 4'-kinase|nr:tetraacyldisaccharide 4'-kinase [Bacillota bacterium]
MNSAAWQVYLMRVINGEESGLGARLILIGLSGLELIYWMLSRFQFWITRRHGLPVPVVSVGNITAGGTGKTPTVIWLVKFLKAAGFHPAILTRGYGGTYEKEGFIFSHLNVENLSAAQTGDEPFLLAKLLPDTLIAVGRERYQNAVKVLALDSTVDLFVLDDGFQHWKLARDLDIVLIDGSKPFSNRHLLPRGFLREPLSSLKRAGIILLTRTVKLSESDKNNLISELMTIHPQAFISTIAEETSELIPLTGFATGDYESRVILAVDFLKGRKVSAITGIGNPRQFLASLENMGAEVGYFKAYPDHYHWEEAEITDLFKGLAESGFKELIITAKDGVKLEPWTDSLHHYGLNCYILSLDFKVSDESVIQRVKDIARKQAIEN